MTSRCTPWAGALLLLIGTLGLAHAASPIVWVPSSNTVVRFHNQAVMALNAGDPERAEARARKTLQTQENFGEAHLILGVALARQSRLDEAIAVLAELDQRAPGRAEVLTELALTWFAKEDFARADAYAMDAVGRNPDWDGGWQALTLVRRRTGDTAQLLVRLHEERSRQDRPALACFQADALVGEKDLIAAEAALRECREGGADPSLVGNVEGALREARGESAAPGGGPRQHLDKAIAAYNSGDMDAAARHATRSIESTSFRLEALLLRAQARFEGGDLVGSQADLDAVLGGAGRSWVALERDGSLQGVVTAEGEALMQERLRGAAAVRVRILATNGESEGWQGALKDGRAALGDCPELRAAEAHALLLEGQVGKAWSVVHAAIQRGDPPEALATVTGTLGFEAAAAASEEMVAAVRLKGTPLAVHNFASGSANVNLWDRCLTLSRSLQDGEGTEARDPKHAEELALVAGEAQALAFSCALAADDLATAELLGTRAGWGAPLPPDDVGRLGAMMLEAGRKADAAALLRRACPEVAEEARAGCEEYLTRAEAP